MRNIAIMLVAILIVLLASFGALYVGEWLLGVALFLLALTATPAAGGYRLHDRMAHATRRLCRQPVATKPR